MALEEYQAKRDFDKTPEPTGGEGSGRLRFVVHKHDASHLHYDLRLEMGGVMPSWAVPKGPSLNPEDKRLALMTEDHPLDYQYFEGVIPEGSYGAGPSMIWDEGTYEPLHATGDRDADDKLARSGVHAGHLTFILHGHKLRGEFALIKMQHAEDNSWLLVKAHKDEFVSTDDVTKLGRSAITSRTIDEIRENKPITKLRLDLGGVPKAPMPAEPKPMLATLAKEPFDSPEWLYEIKWDGYRIMAEIQPDGVTLHTRGRQNYTDKFAIIAQELHALRIPAYLDGEVVVVDEAGRPRFQDLQNYLRTGQGHVLYCVFDILHLDGRDLTSLPLTERKHILQRILGVIHGPHFQYSQHVREQGIGLFKMAQTQGLEGIMAKRADSTYQQDRRSRDWLKLKTHLRQEAVVAGWTEPRGGRQYFGALVLGVYDETGQLQYAGHTGGGFDEATLQAVYERLKPLETADSPIQPAPKTNEPAHWVRPQLVVEVQFTEWTADGSMRHPIFVGLRDDKPATQVRKEEPATTTPESKKPAEPDAGVGSDTTANSDIGQRSSASEEQPAQRQKKGQEQSTQKNAPEPQPLTPPNQSDAKVAINGRSLHLTHLDKVYWPNTGYTKRDLIEHYHTVAPVMLPYLKDRPQSLHRYPNGIEGESFYQKDMNHQPPDWATTATFHSESEDKDINFLICNDEATLIYMANLGCIEINPWNSTAAHPENPDWCVIDLDPEAIGFDAVIQTAQAVHDVLQDLAIPSYPKTSGATGIHIYIPMGRRYDYDQVRMFGQLIANLVHARLPKLTSVERSPAKRKGKIYLDYLQNRRGQTLAAAYSVRPRPGATVSTPLAWDEVKPGLDPAKFTIRNIHDRLSLDNNLWAPVLGPGIDMQSALARIPSKSD